MAHIGQELALGGVGQRGLAGHITGTPRSLFKGAVGLQEILLRPPALSNIAQQAQGSGAAPPGDLDRFGFD